MSIRLSGEPNILFISWTAPKSVTVIMYDIWYKTSRMLEGTSAKAPASTRYVRLTLSHAEPGELLTVKIRAFGSSGKPGDWSTEATFTVPDWSSKLTCCTHRF